jgi:AcrR family transcriptional regulator
VGGSDENNERTAQVNALKSKAGLTEEKDDKKDDDDDKDDKDDNTGEDDKDEDDDKDDEKDEEDFKKKLKEDVDAILASESDLSPEFRLKIATIYEARVIDKVNQIAEELEAQFNETLESAIQTLGEELTTKTNDYLNYVVEEWMGANELAIEKGLRAELVEEFIGGLHALFAEHYIDVPADKVNVLEELAAKVETLEASLNEEIARGVSLKKQLSESKKTEILASVCEGLTAPAADKIRTLAESVEFTAEGDFRKKVEVLRENYFPTKVKQAEAAQLNEQVEEAPVVPAHMRAYADAIARSVNK